MEAALFRRRLEEFHGRDFQRHHQAPKRDGCAVAWLGRGLDIRMHELSALIGSDSQTDLVCQRWPCAARLKLVQGLWIMPLSDEFISEILGRGFEWLSLEEMGGEDLRQLAQAVANGLIHQDIPGRFGLIWTEYWGGEGIQAAAVVERGDLLFGPKRGAGSVNDALSQLGVKILKERDEWDEIGLVRWRSTKDLLDEAAS